MQTPVPSGSTTARDALFVALGIVTLAYAAILVRALLHRAKSGEDVKSTPWMWATSFFCNFWDTLGVGSFATTTSIWRQWRMVPDEKIPGTLNVGYVIPTVIQAFIYTKLVPVESTTLVLMIAASVLGAWLGAGVVSSWPRRTVQISLGLAMFAFGVILVMKNTGIMPPGGNLLGLGGTRLVLAIAGNFMLGAFMTMGIGLYGPCMVLISLLGMNVTAAFPIMMGSCAFLMPLASVRFIRTGGFDPRAIIGMTLAGIPAVLIAAFMVTSFSLVVVNWLVLVVVVYAGTNLLRAARRERDLASAATAAEAQPAI